MYMRLKRSRAVAIAVAGGLTCTTPSLPHTHTHTNTNITKCESKSQSEARCEKYNSFFNIFFEKRREELCTNEPGCDFRGKGITGTCYSKMKLANINKGKKSINIGFDYSDGKSIDQKDMKHKTPLTPSSSSSSSSSSKQLSSTSSSSVVTSKEISSSAPDSSTVTQESLSSSHRSFQDFKGEEDSQIEILMKQQFASSVADQIVNSHQVSPALRFI
jgi:hypothetical protein